MKRLSDTQRDALVLALTSLTEAGRVFFCVRISTLNSLVRRGLLSVSGRRDFPIWKTTTAGKAALE